MVGKSGTRITITANGNALKDTVGVVGEDVIQLKCPLSSNTNVLLTSFDIPPERDT